MNWCLTPPFKALSWDRLSGPFLKPLYKPCLVPRLLQPILEANQSKPLCAVCMHAASHCSPGVCLVKWELLLCVTKESSGCLCRCPLLRWECLLSPCISAYSPARPLACPSPSNSEMAPLEHTCALACPRRHLGRRVTPGGNTCPPAHSPAIFLSSAQAFPLPGSLSSSPWPGLDNPPLGSQALTPPYLMISLLICPWP